jgi:hypothetical protein
MDSKFPTENMKATDHVTGIGLDGRIKLKQIHCVLN